jgi:hypothetical protein
MEANFAIYFEAVIILFCLVALLLGIVPVFHYRRSGYRERREEIIHYFNSEAIAHYFDRFRNARNVADPQAEFAIYYDQRFGAVSYRYPILIYMFALLTAILWIGASASKAGPLLEKIIVPAPDVAWALAGAYFWIVQDLLSRFMRRDLAPSVLYAYSFRFIICVPIAFALVFILKLDSGSAVSAALAFILGIFPTNTLILVLRRQVLQRFGLGDESAAIRYELEDLQGVTTSIAERFSDLGVATNVQLAYEDPIQLTMRMNLPFRFIIDVMSQALLAIYCKNLDLLRKYGIRSSMDAATLYEELGDKDESVRARARAVVEVLAAELGTLPAALEKVFGDIKGDPANVFLTDLPF